MPATRARDVRALEEPSGRKTKGCKQLTLLEGIMPMRGMGMGQLHSFFRTTMKSEDHTGGFHSTSIDDFKECTL